jgi:hypothetical protein
VAWRHGQAADLKSPRAPLTCTQGDGDSLRITLFVRLTKRYAECRLKRLLIGVVVLLLAKIANMALPANICCPAYGTMHDRFVDPDREQHNTVFPAFLFEGCFDFFLDPAAMNRMFGQYEEETVVYL